MDEVIGALQDEQDVAATASSAAQRVVPNNNQTPIPRSTLASKNWANRIAAAWQSSIEGILQTGRLLREARAKLPHGDFQQMVERE